MQTSLIVLSGDKPERKPITEIVVGLDGKILGTGNDWLEDMFKPVPQNKTIRPVLKSEELETIRLAFQTVVQYSPVIGADTKVRNLWSRILRKSG